MKKSENFLVKLLVGVVAGAVLGLLIPQGSTLPFAEAVVNIVGTVKYILGQLINFCVPLIIIGFIAPSITKLGSNATRLLGVAIVIAYVSSVLAAFMSMGAGTVSGNKETSIYVNPYATAKASISIGAAVLK